MGKCLNLSFSTGLKASWQAGPRDAERQGGISNEVQEPLLGKSEGESDGPTKGDHKDTIFFLARMATADLHILLLAFTAGGLPRRHVILLRLSLVDLSCRL